MIFNSRHLLLAATLLALLVAVIPSHAVQFRVLGWSAHDANLRFDAGTTSTEILVFTDALSRIYDFTGDGPLTLYKRVEHEGKPRKQTACSVTIPPDMEQGLLLLIPGDDSKAVDRKVLPNRFGDVSENAPLIYDHVWFDDSPAARPPGTIRFLNLSRLPVALKIDQQQHMLAPQATAQVPITIGARRMAFRAAAQVDGIWKVFTCNPLPTGGAERVMIILRDAPPSGNSAGPRVTMLSLFDWPRPADTTPPPAPVVSSLR